jgi:hypothetical protein
MSDGNGSFPQAGGDATKESRQGAVSHVGNGPGVLHQSAAQITVALARAPAEAFAGAFRATGAKPAQLAR